MRITFIIFSLFLGALIANGQRYLTEIFDQSTVLENIEYAENYILYTFPSPSVIQLHADIYQPSGDTEENRPLVILIHGGYLIPVGVNNRTTGEKEDYAIAETGRRLAKMGYVVAAIEFRQGWNPLAPSALERAHGLTNASYRGMQDLRTFIRFAKQQVDNGNPWKINPDKIAAWGFGTGGMVALMGATIHEIDDLYIPELIDPTTLEPFIDTAMVGNIYGTSEGTYSLINHPDHSSDFQFAFSAGGALIDHNWVDENALPMAMAHVVQDPSIPFGINPITGNVDCNLGYYPFPGPMPVLLFAGPKCLIQLANASEVNSDLLCLDDEITIELNDQELAEPNLWAINRPLTDILGEVAPWEYWDTTYWDPDLNPDLPVEYQTNNDFSLSTNPDMSLEKANRYIDTLLWFFTPRACIALDLGCDVTPCSVGLEDVTQQKPLKVLVTPNPANERVTFQAQDQISTLTLYDLNGRKLVSRTHIHSTNCELDLAHLTAGIYIAKLEVGDRNVVKKIILQ